MARTKSAHLLLIAVMLAGCTGGPEVVTQSLGPLDALTSQADARHVFVKADPEGDGYGRFVAEPPPDAFADFTSSLQLLAEASGENDGAEGKARLEVLNEITKRVVRLGVRSQGLMYLRDAGYRLAEAFANGAFFPSAYEATVRKRLAEKRARTETDPEEQDRFHRRGADQDLGDFAFDLFQQDPDAFRELLEQRAFFAMFHKILDNSKELIEFELRRNPDLSGEFGDRGRRSRLDMVVISLDGKPGVRVTLFDPGLRGKTVPVVIVARDDQDQPIGDPLILRLVVNDQGLGAGVIGVPENSRTVAAHVETEVSTRVLLPEITKKKEM